LLLLIAVTRHKEQDEEATMAKNRNKEKTNVIKETEEQVE